MRQIGGKTAIWQCEERLITFSFVFLCKRKPDIIGFRCQLIAFIIHIKTGIIKKFIRFVRSIVKVNVFLTVLSF